MIRFGSLFSGIGGFDLGFDRAGMQCAWQVEIDKHCRRVLERHWPGVRRWDDVRTFPPEGGWHVDVIGGGFPCKQTSLAAAIHGKRTGLKGTDSGLWYEMLRIVEQIRPSIVVVENTPGVSTWQAEITSCLERAGYAVTRVNASAASVGAPHLRRRVFFVADVDRKRLEVTWSPGSSTDDGQSRGAVTGNPWLSSIAGIMRVADGVPGGMDRRARIERLGNAVVPQLAEWIGRRIVENW